MKALKISLICDIKDSFMHEQIPSLKKELEGFGHQVNYLKDMKELAGGDVAFFLSCSMILKEEQLRHHLRNVIIHPSKLPQARGSGVVAWKILEGENKIWVTLFNPTGKIDAGEIYDQDYFELSGDELCDEIRRKQAELSFKLIKKFLADYPDVETFPQKGESSFYGKRKPQDSQLDINKSIKEQFNLLRVADNQRYPAFFLMNGKKYILKISRADCSD